MDALPGPEGVGWRIAAPCGYVAEGPDTAAMAIVGRAARLIQVHQASCRACGRRKTVPIRMERAYDINL